MLEGKASVNLQNSLGETSLFLASYDENVPVVSLLLEYGADPNIPDNNGNLPISYASDEIETLLKNFGAEYSE